ncbi:SGNH hydrolase [Polyplosphaeria fusca]|uniref:SGNH hydrolase n=1 Tax=Polyplosphaeria fusca TaxID=682080 RepID=A0A9P4QQE9_9PLEO|nr:SGNH hydrolase [Polyplosphaeria fusca]
MRSFQKTSLLASLYLQAAHAYPADTTAVTKRDGIYVWGAIGDSWGSGVSYNIFGKTDYDGNKDECLRVNHAYSVRVNEDNSWVPDGKTQEFHFAACSGSRMRNMAFEEWRGYKQMDAVGVPGLITMQAGGNDVGFYNVATSCLFHVEDGDYGPVYPDPAGRCKQAIDGARDYIQKDGAPGLGYDMKATIQDVLDHPSHSGDPEFRLFVIGYGHFFNVDDDSTWCNDFSFVLPWKDRSQKLTLELRRDINNLVEETNRKTADQVASFNDPKVQFVDSSPAFQGARFCETGHGPWDQFFGNKVLLWNASPEGVILKSSDNEYTLRDTEPTEDEFNKWLETGTFTDDPNEISLDSYDTNAEAFSGPRQGASPGVLLRPFHPKADGHANMAKIIVDQIKASFSEQAPPPASPAKTHGFNVLFHNYIDEISNTNTWAFFAQEAGKGPGDVCSRKPDSESDDIGGGPGDYDAPPWPKGEWKVNGGEDDCTYSSDGNGPGTLKCPSMSEAVNCVEDSAKAGEEDASIQCPIGAWADNFHAVAWCEW